MKNKNLFLKVLLGAIICAAVTVVLNILFQKWKLFGFDNRSLEKMISEGIFTGILFFITMFLFAKKRIQKTQANKKDVN